MDRIKKTALALYSGVVTIGLLFSLMAFQNLRESFEEIDARKITIVNEEGQRVLVMANREKFPLPFLNGKEHQRDINPSGLVFYDDKGNECGGLGVVNVPEGEKIAFVLDYATVDGIAMYKTETTDGSYVDAGFSINDPNPSGQIGDAVNRVELSNTNKTAGLILRDSRGKARIKILVTEEGTPKIQLLDTTGKVMKDLATN